MLRTFILVPLILTAAAALAEDALQAQKAPHEPTAEKQAAAKEQTRDAGETRKGAAKSAAIKHEAVKSESAQSEAAKPAGDVKMSGMSILGNDDAPKSLVLVPWKSSQLGDMPSLSKLLDDSTQPVDKDVFMRELAYYQIKSESK